MTNETHDIHGTTNPDQERLWDLIKDTRAAMFTVRHANGHLHSRPMTMQNKSIEADASLWFFMSRRSEPVHDFAAEPDVNVAFADPGADRYVSVSGKAAEVQDMEKKRQLWSKMAEGWFPGGVDDPDLALVQVKITHANYWDVKDSKLVQMFKMAKAAMTGTPPTDMGEHGELRMR